MFSDPPITAVPAPWLLSPQVLLRQSETEIIVSPREECDPRPSRPDASARLLSCVRCGRFQIMPKSTVPSRFLIYRWCPAVMCTLHPECQLPKLQKHRLR
ncbi:hypothetical protein NDU88_005727 [Pleurodeles waltl]|uniref:Uncharacterized protein n=1 Tax=Pleurodeles waltl TaxID=8319 RepID=A0AAV7W8M8_PLEWA|nr:hypothetical protein NDU88_005727 [Pleurodeles waltl]